MVADVFPRPRPVMLVILDGFGYSEAYEHNAVRQARTPHFDALMQTSPHAFLRTSGEDVGLPEGQMGNSEVGHLTIGAGRVVMQDLPRISRAVKDGTLKDNATLQDLIGKLKKSGGTCHLMGLVSPGGVHAHHHHIAALARIVAEEGVNVALHLFTDGRDTPPRSGEGFVAEMVDLLPDDARIATVTGRYYAMDRDKRWERVKLAYDALAFGQGAKVERAEDVLPSSYQSDVNDEFVLPHVIGGYHGMKDGDALLAANFRADRIRQILNAFLQPHFDGFARGPRITFVAAAGMTPYGDELAPLMTTLFPKENLSDLLGEVVASAGLRQLRMAETEKYPHVTYFLNGGKEGELAGEARILIPSPKVATYDLQPEMSAAELTDRAVEAIESAQFDLIVLNFANPDMVGHSGILSAAIKACEAVDENLGRIDQALEKVGGALLVTADHGNCETMKNDETGGAHTSHTLNLVPVILKAPGVTNIIDGRLADVAPTLLALLKLKQPLAMTGTSLIAPP